MAIPLSELDDLDSRDLVVWIRPTPVDTAKADMMLAAAVELVKEMVKPRTEVPGTAKAVVLEAAARACRPRVQQESLGSRSVSYFQPGDPRSGVFLTDDELGQLGVATGIGGVGVAWSRASNIRSRFGIVP